MWISPVRISSERAWLKALDSSRIDVLSRSSPVLPNSVGIAAAAIDVSEEEPIAPDDPLLGLDNIIITPHIASASVATRLGMAKMAVDNLLTALRGQVPPQCVNRQAVRRWRRALPR